MVLLKCIILVYLTFTLFSKWKSNELIKKCDFKPTHFFYWNKTKHSPLEYYLGLCTKRCNGSLEVTTQPLSNFQCDFCSCLRPACEIYDNCCPDVSVPIYDIDVIKGDPSVDIDPFGAVIQNTNQIVTTKKKIMCTRKKMHFLFVGLCLPDYQENETISSLCETELNDWELTLDTFTKVMDNSTGVVYKNIYCAICNRVSKIIQMKFKLEFDHYMYAYTARSASELLEMQIRHQIDLLSFVQNYTFENPLHRMECYPFLVPSKSNAMIKDQDLLEACHQMGPSHGLMVKDILTNTFHQNIFCAIANQRLFPVPVSSLCYKPSLLRVPSAPAMSFSMLLNFRTGEETDEVFAKQVCLNKEWRAPNDQCIELKCTPGKQLKGNNCVEIIQEITQLAYSFQLYYVTQKVDAPKLSPFFTGEASIERTTQLFFTQLTVNDTVTPPDVSISIHFNEVKIVIQDNTDLIMVEVNDNKELDVCVDLLDRLVTEHDKKSKRQGKWCAEKLCWIEYILTLTCFSLSAVCLLLTMMIYLMVSELRTIAGLNNFFLSCSLLLAQLSSLASISIFQRGIHCQVLGVVTHFLWLWNFSWSFICSYHMFRVFTDHSRTRAVRATIGGMWKSVCGSFMLPVCVVMTSIGYNYVMTEQRNIGYGKTRCYLDSALSVGISVAAPVLVISLVNVTFFLKVVYTIYKVRTLQSLQSAGTEFDVTIYVKLSTVTGMFWIVAFLAESLDSELLNRHAATNLLSPFVKRMYVNLGELISLCLRY
nr:adhesion G protein-coupled receptor L2-like; partial [Biomphalaria glabrata]